MDLENEIKEVLSYESTKAQWRNNHSSSEYRKTDKVATIIMGQGLLKKKNCGCLEDLFIMLKSLNKNNINQKQKQMSNLFKLKDDVLIMVHGVDRLSIHNMTDEKAINLLKKYPSHIESFESYPSDWKKLIGKEEVKEVKEEEFEGVSDRMELLEEANVLAELKGIKKINARSGVEKIKIYIESNK